MSTIEITVTIESNGTTTTAVTTYPNDKKGNEASIKYLANVKAEHASHPTHKFMPELNRAREKYGYWKCTKYDTNNNTKYLKKVRELETKVEANRAELAKQGIYPIRLKVSVKHI